jgi:Ca2+-binding RTX toxin-like protein
MARFGAVASMERDLMPYVYQRGTNGDDTVDFSATATFGVMYAAGDGNDAVIGSAFADRMNGGAGNDTLMGGSSNDMLVDGAGSDRLIGGEVSFDPTGLAQDQILARLGGGNDTYILQNDAGADIVAGFDGIGTPHGAGPHDFLWLQGYAAGSQLVFDQYLGSSVGSYTTATIWVSTQYYKVETAGGAVQDYIILQSFGATQTAADQKLVHGDYAFLA